MYVTEYRNVQKCKNKQYLLDICVNIIVFNHNIAAKSGLENWYWSLGAEGMRWTKPRDITNEIFMTPAY